MKKCSILLIMIALIVTGCGRDGIKTTSQEEDIPRATHPIISKEDYPRIDGSTATIPLSLALYQLVTENSMQDAEETIVHTKTTGAYKRLIDHEVDMLIVYEGSKEIDKYAKEQKVELLSKPIGMDALVFFVNPKNQVTSLTNNQLIDIYSGKYTNWSQVGGMDKKIVAFQRPDQSGSQNLMEKLVMKGTKMMAGPKIIRPVGMQDIVEQMTDYVNESNALGYSVFYYVSNMIEQPDMRLLDVGGIEPTQQAIQDGTYPYTNSFYVVIREDEKADSNARKLYDWLTTEDGQKLVEDTGYVSIK